ncbi:MAG: hypothetical protein ACE5HB_04025 [Terriglobia bacterium]
MRKAIGVLAILLLSAGAASAQFIPKSLAEVARKVRAQRASQNLPKARLYTNDSIPKAGDAVSVVGTVGARRSAGTDAGNGDTAAAEGQQDAECDEACWRQQFDAKRKEIAQAERDLDILQREYNLARTQYYQDPNQAVREQYSNTTGGGAELQRLMDQINQKQADIQRLQRELGDLENDLRRAGGKPGWARPQ